MNLDVKNTTVFAFASWCQNLEFWACSHNKTRFQTEVETQALCIVSKVTGSCVDMPGELTGMSLDFGILASEGNSLASQVLDAAHCLASFVGKAGKEINLILYCQQKRKDAASLDSSSVKISWISVAHSCS